MYVCIPLLPFSLSHTIFLVGDLEQDRVSIRQGSMEFERGWGRGVYVCVGVCTRRRFFAVKILYGKVLYCVTKEKFYCATNHPSRDHYLILTIKVFPHIVDFSLKKLLLSTCFLFGSYQARYVEIYRGRG